MILSIMNDSALMGTLLSGLFGLTWFIIGVVTLIRVNKLKEKLDKSNLMIEYLFEKNGGQVKQLNDIWVCPKCERTNYTNATKCLACGTERHVE